MEKFIYRRENTNGWPDFVVDKFSDLLTSVYGDGPIAETEDRYHIIIESIESDVIFYLEDNGKSLGYTAVKLMPELGPDVIYVREIAVDPTRQGRGLSRELRLWMNETLKPKIILGVAQNPVSVISRAKTFDPLGFQTYWGNLPVAVYGDDWADTVTKICHEFVAYAFPEYLKDYTDGALPYTDSEIWAEPAEGFSPNIDLVLGRIISLQEKLKTPAIAPLVSISSRPISDFG